MSFWSAISGGVTSGYNYVSSYVAESYLGQGGASSRVELRPLRTPARRTLGGSGSDEMSAGQRQLAKYDPKSKYYEGTSSDRQAALEKTLQEAADDPEIELEDMGEWLEPYEPPEYVSRGSPVTAELSGPWVPPERPAGAPRAGSGLGYQPPEVKAAPVEAGRVSDPTLSWEEQQLQDAELEAEAEGGRGRVVEPRAADPTHERVLSRSGDTEMVAVADEPPAEMMRVAVELPPEPGMGRGGTMVSEMPRGGGFLSAELREAGLTPWADQYEAGVRQSMTPGETAGRYITPGHEKTYYGEEPSLSASELGEPSRMEGQRPSSYLDEPSRSASLEDSDLMGTAEVDPETEAVMKLVRGQRTAGGGWEFEENPPRLGSAEYGESLAARESAQAQEMGIEMDAPYQVSEFPSGRIAFNGAAGAGELTAPLLGEPPALPEVEGMMESIGTYLGYAADALGGWEAMASGGLSLAFTFAGQSLLDLGERKERDQRKKEHSSGAEGLPADKVAQQTMDSVKYDPGYLHMKIGDDIYSFPAWPVRWAPDGVIPEWTEAKGKDKKHYTQQWYSDESQMIVGFRDLTGYYREVQCRWGENPFTYMKDTMPDLFAPGKAEDEKYLYEVDPSLPSWRKMYHTTDQWGTHVWNKRTQLTSGIERITKVTQYSEWRQEQVEAWLPYCTTNPPSGAPEIYQLHYYPQLAEGTPVYLPAEVSITGQAAIGVVVVPPVPGEEPKYEIKITSDPEFPHTWRYIWDIMVGVPKPLEQLDRERKEALTSVQTDIVKALIDRGVPKSGWKTVMQTAAELGYMSKEKWPTSWDPSTLYRWPKNDVKLNWGHFSRQEYEKTEGYGPHGEKLSYGKQLYGGPKKQMYIRGTEPLTKEQAKLPGYDWMRKGMLKFEEAETRGGVKQMKARRSAYMAQLLEEDELVPPETDDKPDKAWEDAVREYEEDLRKDQEAREAKAKADEPWTIPEEWSDPEDRPGEPIRYEPSHWKKGVKGVHRDVFAGKGKRTLGSQRLVALKPGSDIQGGDLGRVSYGIKDYKTKYATWWGDMTQADYKAQFYKAESWEVYPREMKKGDIFYIEPGRGWSTVSGLRRVHKIEVKKEAWIAYGQTVYWVTVEWPLPGGAWSRYGHDKDPHLGPKGGSWQTCVFHKPAKTKADVAISAVPGVRWSAEQLDLMMLTPDEDPGTPIRHRVKGYKDELKLRHLEEERDAEDEGTREAHADLPHVRRRRRLAHDRDRLIVWPYWWVNFLLTEAVPDQYEDTQELFMVNWEVLNALAFSMTKRLGFRSVRKMVVTYDDPPRAGFTWYNPSPENPYSFTESDPQDFPTGFYNKPKRNLQQGDFYVTARRSRGDIMKQQRDRQARPWRFWRFWVNTSEPYILGNDPPRGLEDAISTDLFDAQKYSRSWLGRFLSPNHIPLYRYLWAILEQATNHEDGFRALVTRMILPSTDAALVPLQHVTKNVLAFIWRQCSDALTFLKTIVWNKRYDPREDFEAQNIPDNYEQLRAQSIALRKKANKGKDYTPANDALWEQLDPFFFQIRDTMNAVAAEWDFRGYPSNLGAEGDALMNATNNGTERLVEFLGMPSYVSGVRGPERKAEYPLRPSTILGRMQVDEAAALKMELDALPEPLRHPVPPAPPPVRRAAPQPVPSPTGSAQMREWSERLRDELWKHLWTGVHEHKGQEAKEMHLYPILKELKLTPAQVVAGLVSGLAPDYARGYLKFHMMNYNVYPKLMCKFFGLPTKPAKAGWDKWIADMQPFLEVLKTPGEAEAYGKWLAESDSPEEEEEEAMAIKSEPEEEDDPLAGFASAPLPQVERAASPSPSPAPQFRRSSRLARMVKQVKYFPPPDPEDTEPLVYEDGRMETRDAYVARLEQLGYTIRQIDEFGAVQFTPYGTPEGSVVDPDEDAPLLPVDHPMAPPSPPVAAAPPAVAAAIQVQDPPAGYDVPTPAEVIEQDPQGLFDPLPEEMDLPPIDDIVDFPVEMPSLEPDVGPLERAPLVFSPLQVIGRVMQAAVGLPIPAPQSGQPVRRPTPARKVATSDFLVPVAVAFAFFIIASQL